VDRSEGLCPIANCADQRRTVVSWKWKDGEIENVGDKLYTGTSLRPPFTVFISKRIRGHGFLSPRLRGKFKVSSSLRRVSVARDSGSAVDHVAGKGEETWSGDFAPAVERSLETEFHDSPSVAHHGII
jgi:hypothetical protein